MLDFINQTNDRDINVLDFHHPSQITKAMDFSIPDTGMPLDSLVSDCRAALRYQVKTGHPHFFNQLSQGLDIVSMAGEWLAAAANANMFTYEIAPVFIMMEHEVLLKMREIIGWAEGDSILAPGGSISNMYALIIARHKHFPGHKEAGMMGLERRPVLYTSKHVGVRSIFRRTYYSILEPLLHQKCSGLTGSGHFQLSRGRCGLPRPHVPC